MAGWRNACDDLTRWAATVLEMDGARWVEVRPDGFEPIAVYVPEEGFDGAWLDRWSARVVQERTLVVTPEAPTNPGESALGPATDVSFFAGVPLFQADGEIDGVLSVLHRGPRPWGPREGELLTFLGRQAQMLRRGAQAEVRERQIQDQWAEAAASHRALLDTLPGLYFLLSPSNRFLEVHGASKSQLFFEEAAVVGRTIGEVYPPSFARMAEDLIERSRSLGEVVVEEYGTPFPDDPRRFEARVHSPGPHANTVVVTQDVTPRARAVQSLQKHKALLEAIVRAHERFIGTYPRQATFDGLLADLLSLTESEMGFFGEVFHDPDGAPYLQNAAISTTFWRSPSGLRYERPGTPGMVFRNLDSLFGEVLKTNHVVISNDPSEDPRRCGLPPGHPPLDNFLGLPLRVGNELIGMAGVANRKGGYTMELVQFLEPFCTSVGHLMRAVRTEGARVAADAALADERLRLRALFETVVDGILTTNAEGVVEEANPAAEGLFGVDADGLRGAKLSDLLHAPKNSLGENAQPLRATIHGGQNPVEMEAVLATGRRVPVEVAQSPLSWKAGPLRAYVIRDIAQRKEMEKLQTAFISTVSHELRTPLTSIRGALGLMAAGVFGALPPEAAKFTQMALYNSNRLGRLVDEILDIGRLRQGALELSLQRIDLRAVVEQALAAHEAMARTRKVSLQWTNPPESVVVLGDPDRLAQVFANLLSNATNVSAPGETIEVTMERGGDGVRVAFRDHGPGLPKDFMPRLFTPFSQADASSTAKRGGTGLGLHIAKGLMDRMGGRLSYEPADGGGARFVVTMPEGPSPTDPLPPGAEGRAR